VKEVVKLKVVVGGVEGKRKRRIVGFRRGLTSFVVG